MTPPQIRLEQVLAIAASSAHEGEVRSALLRADGVMRKACDAEDDDDVVFVPPEAEVWLLVTDSGHCAWQFAPFSDEAIAAAPGSKRWAVKVRWDSRIAVIVRDGTVHRIPSCEELGAPHAAPAQTLHGDIVAPFFLAAGDLDLVAVTGEGRAARFRLPWNGRSRSLGTLPGDPIVAVRPVEGPDTLLCLATADRRAVAFAPALLSERFRHVVSLGTGDRVTDAKVGRTGDLLPLKFGPETIRIRPQEYVCGLGRPGKPAVPGREIPSAWVTAIWHEDARAGRTPTASRALITRAKAEGLDLRPDDVADLLLTYIAGDGPPGVDRLLPGRYPEATVDTAVQHAVALLRACRAEAVTELLGVLGQTLPLEGSDLLAVACRACGPLVACALVYLLRPDTEPAVITAAYEGLTGTQLDYRILANVRGRARRYTARTWAGS